MFTYGESSIAATAIDHLANRELDGFALGEGSLHNDIVHEARAWFEDKTVGAERMRIDSVRQISHGDGKGVALSVEADHIRP